MNTQEILDKGINYTFYDYLFKLNKNTISNYNIPLMYSSMILVNIINNKAKAFNAYSNKLELKEEMKTLNTMGIKKELLKNIVNNAILIKLNEIQSINLNETRIRSNFNADELSVSVYNNMLMYGVEQGYKMLNNRHALYNACELYVRNRINNRASFFDEVALLNKEGVAIYSAIDEYFDNKSKSKENAKILIKK